MISEQKLKDAERMVRITMILILLTAGTSKFFSGDGFFNYYSQLFQGDLRINLPPLLINLYLKVIPFIEIFLGFSLFMNKYKNYTVYAWFVFMLSLLFGHYILQEWSSVNQMLGYIFLGLLCFILPNHSSWFNKSSYNESNG
ncbi:MAG: hypothetical protein GXP14_06855 [Gammaproteobacteria bacterium]|nr:hypothetical protein [Gammaproteobacteria bacterium]